MTPLGTTTQSRFDQAVVAAAEAVEDAMRNDLLTLVGQEAAVVAAAPAGAGKSHFVSATVGQLRAEGLQCRARGTHQRAGSQPGRAG